MGKTPNLLLLGIDSLSAGHMSLYGYDRLTTPHIDRLAAGGSTFDNTISPSIPTTSGYSSMLTGMDCFGTDVRSRPAPQGSAWRPPGDAGGSSGIERL